MNWREQERVQNQKIYKPKEIPAEFRTTKIPCQNCGKLVEVTLDENGYFFGCVFCRDCIGGWSAGTEGFSKERVF